MGNKRKRSDDQQHNKDKPSSSTVNHDSMPCSSGMELFSKEIRPYDSHELNSLSSVMDPMESPSKLLNAHHSISHHHHSLGRTLLLKRSRHSYGHQYSRRNSVSHSSASTSQGKVTHIHDEKLPFKLASQCYSDSISREDPENFDRAYFRPERIRACSSIIDGVSPAMAKIICGTCQKPLRRKSCTLGNAASSSEPSVVAVLVCGHVYHADCLEQETCPDDKQDPPCPLCRDFLSEADDSKEHN